ncbi:MAG: hydroxymethylglutaryl-CoA lyase [Deltaproteobacteria bacterium]
MDTSQGKDHILLQEVGPRDGLQNEPQVLSPEVRADLVNRLVAAGLERVQIGSFVNPRLVPQMAGTDSLWRRVEKRPGVRYSALVLNQRGLDSAIAADIPHVEIYVSASETHSMKNANVSVERAVASASEMIERALNNGMGVTAGVMCAFGCFYEGAVPVERVSEIVRSFQEKNPTEIGLADTTGMGEPEGMSRMIHYLEKMVPPDRIALHLHDTRGLGLENLRAGLSAGIRRFDTSVGGLGGCPFIPGAVGNISTERTVEFLQSLGFETGINLEKMREIRGEVEKLLEINAS